MVLYVIFVTLRTVIKKELQGRVYRGKRIEESHGGNKYTVIGSLLSFDDYFEGAGYGSGRADSFAQKAPATLFRLNNCDNTANQHQGLTGTYVDAQSAPVTLFQFNHWHFNQRHFLHFLTFILNQRSNICL